MSASLNELESHLFKCTDSVYDVVGPTDYYEYILPLVYYKTIFAGFEIEHRQIVVNYLK